MRLFSGLQLCHAVRSGATTRCPLHALLLRPASDPAPELPGAQRPVGPELGQSGQQWHQQHRRAHAQRPDPAAPVPAPRVSPRSPGSPGWRHSGLGLSPAFRLQSLMRVRGL